MDTKCKHYEIVVEKKPPGRQILASPPEVVEYLMRRFRERLEKFIQSEGHHLHINLIKYQVYRTQWYKEINHLFN